MTISRASSRRGTQTPLATRRVPALLRAGVSGGVLIALTAACTAAVEPDPADMVTMCDAVIAENPRIVEFEECDSYINGLGRTITLDPNLDTTAPLTPREIHDVVESVWTHAPFEPNGIHLIARDAATGQVPIDLLTPARQLEDRYGTELLFGPVGDQGVSVIGMRQEFGDWKPPS